MLGSSQTWQLVNNPGPTLVASLMVFLIQHAQNKDSRAVHLKLNELLASHEYASNRLVAIEDLDEESLLKLHDFYCRLAELAEQEGGLKVSHSADEAEQVHSRKKRARQASAGALPRETRPAPIETAADPTRRVNGNMSGDMSGPMSGAQRQRGRSTRRENA